MRPSRVALLAATLWLTACGPWYTTDYKFIPPPAPQSRVCVLQCESNRLQCQQIQDMQKENCEDRAEMDYRWCESRRAYEYRQDGSRRCVRNCSCTRRYCGGYDRATCEAHHRTCFQFCGGTIVEEKRCVFNCP